MSEGVKEGGGLFVEERAALRASSGRAIESFWECRAERKAMVQIAG